MNDVRGRVPGASPAPVAPDYAACDDPDELARIAEPFEVPDGQRLEVVLDVPAIHCAACTVKVEQALAPLAERTTANAATRRVRVRWDPVRVPLSALLERIDAIGYPALPLARDAASLVQARERRRALWRLFVAGFCMMQVMMYSVPRYVAAEGEIPPDIETLLKWAEWMLTVPVVVFSAAPMFGAAWRDLRERRVGMDVPVALGIGIAFVASTAATFGGGGDVWYDSVTMFVTFLLAGRWLETRARERAARGIDALLARMPETVERLREAPPAAAGAAAEAASVDLAAIDEAGLERVPAWRLRAGDRVRVAVGQGFPADGVVVEGRSHADESLLTGESTPIAKGPGDPVVAGSHNLDGPLWLRVVRTGNATRYGQIADLVRRAADEKPRLARIADRWAQVFLVAVLVAAAAAGLWWWMVDPSRVVPVVVAVLIVTCPCAFSLATPAATLAATGRLASLGVLLRTPEALEPLARADLFAFDKTGTLSLNRLALQEAKPLGEGLPASADASPAAVALAVAAALERGSLHPVARALVDAARADALQLPAARDVIEIPGEGVAGVVDAGDGPRVFRLGRRAFALGAGAPAGRDANGRGADAGTDGGLYGEPEGADGVWLGAEGRALARFRFAEALRPDAHEALAALAADGTRLAILSGDRDEAVARLVEGLPIDERVAGATPEAKHDWIRSAQAAGWSVAMVGDGINDAPGLALADVSVAVGSAAPIAQSRADLVLLADRLTDLVEARRTARRTMHVVRQNLGWAAAYNAVSVPLALVGWMPPWLAGAGMAASSLLVVLNALRLAR